MSRTVVDNTKSVDGSSLYKHSVFVSLCHCVIVMTTIELNITISVLHHYSYNVGYSLLQFWLLFIFPVDYACAFNCIIFSLPKNIIVFVVMNIKSCEISAAALLIRWLRMHLGF